MGGRRSVPRSPTSANNNEEAIAAAIKDEQGLKEQEMEGGTIKTSSATSGVAEVLGRPVTALDLSCPEQVAAAEAWVREHIPLPSPAKEEEKEPSGDDGGKQQQEGKGPVVIGIDCEWQAPWFRGSAPERLCTLQVASVSGVLLARVRHVDRLPPALVEVLECPHVLKAGVNVRGDCERLRRDLKVRTRGLHELTRGMRTSEASLQALAYKVLGLELDKDKGISCSDWGQWPLTDRQVEYACMDAAVCVDIYYQGEPEMRERQEDGDNPWGEDGHEVEDDSKMKEEEGGGGNEDAGGKENVAPSSAGHSDFFLMMRNKSLVPPNRGMKEYPQGKPDALSGRVFVISGVLDSFERSECSAYISRHGGVVRSSITKATTHLLNDHGEIGPRKIKEAKRLSIPIIGEDALLAMVVAGRTSSSSTSTGAAKAAGGSAKKGREEEESGSSKPGKAKKRRKTV